MKKGTGGGKPFDVFLKEKLIEEMGKTHLVEGSVTITVEDAVRRMQQEQAGYVVLTEKKKVVGIFTEVDLARKVLPRNVDWKTPVRQFMTPDPFVLTPQDSVQKAIELMEQHRIYHIPLVDANQELVGVLSVRALIKFLAECYPTEVFNLPPRPDQFMETAEGG